MIKNEQFLLKDFNFEALVEQKFARLDVNLVDAYIVLLPDSKSINKLNEKLVKLFPLDIKYSFLKRVKPPINKNDVFKFLIGHVNKTNYNEIETKLKTLNLTIIEIAKIPEYKPLTRKQFEFARKFWHCSFHENKYLEKCLSGQNLFKDEYIAKNLSHLIKLTKEKNKCIALITDKDEIIVEKESCIEQNFLHHSTIKAINEVAENQMKISNLKLNNQTDEKLKNYIVPYLCTSYDVYLTNEPCVFCAMALLHSRIKRLFYFDFNYLNENYLIKFLDCMDDYALTKLNIHNQKSLNHHFEVFKVTLK